MTHHAYAFDLYAFARDELRSILLEALSSGDTSGLIRYIEANRDHLKDRDEGGPLSDNWQDWQDVLVNLDVQELGGIALTRFFDPLEDGGLMDAWLAIYEHLSEADRAALLGTPLRSSDVYFDPSGLGAFFQTPQQVVKSLARVQRIELPDVRFKEVLDESLEQFKELLKECAEAGNGLYVTF
jgi:hypothetical protein